MQNGFWVASSALNQHQRALDVLDHNLANLNTTGFKASRTLFADVFSQTLKLGGAPNENGSNSVNPLQVGHGVSLFGIEKNFNQGETETTGRKLDVALWGNGKFVFKAPTDAADGPVYYSRNGNLEIDANAGVAVGAVPNAAGPINIVNASGYALQGINATYDAATGQYTISASPTSPTTIAFDERATVGPLATTAVTFGYNLDSEAKTAIDPVTLQMANTGVDRTARIEFQRASADIAGSSYYYFWVQNPTQAADGSYATLNDGITGSALAGVVRVDANGNVTNTYQTTNTTPPAAILTAAQVGALSAWANVNGLGQPIFTVGTAPITGIANEVIQRPTLPATTMALAAPAAFTLANGAYDAGTLAITQNGRTLTAGVDYTEAAGTGVITPRTAWAPGDVLINYTKNAGSIVVSGERVNIANANGTQGFRPANVPIQPGTLVVNATRNGAAVVANTDYTVDTTTGEITPLTFWDPVAAVTVNYSQADTRVTVTHNVPGIKINFTQNSIQPNGFLTVEPAPRAEITEGAASSIIDSLDNEHHLQFEFERVSREQWTWNATPHYRFEQPATAINNSASGGGTTLDGMTVMPNTLIANPDGTYQIEISIDEGADSQSWTQLPTTSTFPLTGGNTRFFKVVNAATGEIAFSRDINTTSGDFEVFSSYKASAPAGNGILGFDATGAYDATNSSITTPISFTPQGAAAVSIAPDFTLLSQAARESDATVTNFDGFHAGKMTAWNFDPSGFISADFSNGQKQNIARVVIATFPNPEGLVARGETSFVGTSNSGTPTYVFADPSTSLGVRLQPEALERSNVDVSLEMTNLIIYQRSYQFNARIVTATDELIKEAIALKR